MCKVLNPEDLRPLENHSLTECKWTLYEPISSVLTQGTIFPYRLRFLSAPYYDHKSFWDTARTTIFEHHILAHTLVLRQGLFLSQHSTLRTLSAVVQFVFRFSFDQCFVSRSLEKWIPCKLFVIARTNGIFRPYDDSEDVIRSHLKSYKSRPPGRSFLVIYPAYSW